MTPEVSFAGGGYCLETCNLCSQVCPSGSITLFSPDAKNRIFMGSAELVYEDCLLAKNSECDRCKVACKFDAIKIEAVPGSLLMKPFISTVKCVGCGACAVICPPATIKMLPPPLV
jgi:formate hydrogenlyase subunit 6/NADH:ubiquinone oxidoreductase subunit I